MKNKLINSLSWSAASTIIKAILQLLQLIVVSRYFDSHELGVYAVANIFYLFIFILSESGLSSAVIYFKDAPKSQIRNVYTLNVMFSIFVAFIFFIISGPISLLYENKDLHVILSFLSLLVVLRVISQTPLAILQRDMKFDYIAKIETVSFLSSFTTLVLMLQNDLGVLSIVIAFYVQAFIQVILVFIVVDRSYIRPMMPNVRKVKGFLRYGAFQTLENFLNYISSSSDSILISYYLGLDKVGVYNYLKDISMRISIQVINPIFNRVFFPYIVSTKDIVIRKNNYLKLVSITSLINFSLYSILILNSELILSLINNDWVQYENLFCLIILYAMLLSLGNPLGVLVKATGRVELGFYWNLAVSFIRPTVILSSISQGIETLLISLIVSNIIVLLVHVKVMLRRMIDITTYEWLKVLLLPFAFNFIVLFISKLNLIPSYTVAFNLILSTIVAFICFILTLRWKYQSA